MKISEALELVKQRFLPFIPQYSGHEGPRSVLEDLVLPPLPPFLQEAKDKGEEVEALLARQREDVCERVVLLELINKFASVKHENTMLAEHLPRAQTAAVEGLKESRRKLMLLVRLAGEAAAKAG